MLRITVDENSTTWRLDLSGKLAGPWVAETANVWRSAPSAAKQIEVDLKQVTGVDAAGRLLLTAMHQAGARLIAEGIANSALVDEITHGAHPHNNIRKAMSAERSRPKSNKSNSPGENTHENSNQ